VIVGPAGTGKTRALATAAQAWAPTRGSSGQVFGTATSQNVTNELRNAGVQTAANTTRLLASIERGEIPPGSLIVVDEGSMISFTHLAALVSHAARNGCKVVLAGDQEQLAAVEGGGAMMLLADRLGYVQLAEPVRFTAEWERQASLRLREGMRPRWTTTTSTAESAAPRQTRPWTRPPGRTWPVSWSARTSS